MLIVLDPGHGGYDSGAVGLTGIKEKDITLKIALRAKVVLEKYGVQVICTREEDVFLGLDERVSIANKAGADYFISIHCNAYINPTANGTETYVYSKSGARYELAVSIQNQLIKELQLRDRGVKEAGFTVLVKTEMPAVLTELAFISNTYEESLLAAQEFQDKAAYAIAKGTLDYLGIDTSESEHWGQPALNKLLELGLITEAKDPEGFVTWAEFSVVILRALGIWK